MNAQVQGKCLGPTNWSWGLYSLPLLSASVMTFTSSEDRGLNMKWDISLQGLVFQIFQKAFGGPNLCLQSSPWLKHGSGAVRWGMGSGKSSRGHCLSHMLVVGEGLL